MWLYMRFCRTIRVYAQNAAYFVLYLANMHNTCAYNRSHTQVFALFVHINSNMHSGCVLKMSEPQIERRFFDFTDLLNLKKVFADE